MLPPINNSQSIQMTLSNNNMAQNLVNLLKPGNLVSAQVIEQQSAGAFMLRIGEHTITVQTSVGLQIGQWLHLQVGNKNNQIILHLLSYETHSHVTKSQSDTQEPNVWLMTVPVRDGKDITPFQIAIEEHKASPDEEKCKSQWLVTLAFDLPALGPMQARIGCQQDHVSAHLWATHDCVVHKMEETLSALKSNLEQAGLNVNQIAAHQGQLKTQHPAEAFPALVDKKA